MSAPLPSELEQKLNYDSIPLSKRLQMVGTTTMTKNSLQTEVQWDHQELNFVDKETGYTPLMAACLNGNAASVSTLIDRGADLNYQEPKRGRTGLILACKNGKAEVVEVLLHRGAAVSITDRNGVTALMWSSKNGHIPCVVSLLSRGAGINTFDNFDWTAVHYAAKHGHREIVELLAGAGAALQIREKLEEGKTPLMLAAQYGRRDTVNSLLDHGSDINARTTKDDLTALMLAAKEGHKGTVKVLLERGADARMCDVYGWTALHFASSWGRKETATILIVEGGALVNAMPRKKLSGGGGTTPLIVATKGQQVEVLAILLEHGGDPALNDEATGRNIMCYAAAEGLTSVVKCLIDHGVDLNMRDSRGMTPLMLAVINGHGETLRLLLAACANINLMDTENKTALDHATDAGQHRRDMYLLAILHSSAACKANVVAWLERDTPKMIRGSPSGGPAVFLNTILYGADGLFSGLYNRPAEQDSLLLHNLVMLSSACQKSVHTQPFDSHDLQARLAEIDDMLLQTLDCRSFASDENLAHALLLQRFPEATLAGGYFDYRFFGAAFVSGPLALYLENGLTRWLGSDHIKRVIDQTFFSSLRGPGTVNPTTGYGSRSVFLRLRYCPAAMFVMEGVSKMLLLSLLVSVLRDPKAPSTYLSTLSDQTLLQSEMALMILTVLSVVYELGAMEEKGWATAVAVSIDPTELENTRYWSARLHMVSGLWSSLDLATLLLLLLWGLLKLSVLSDGISGTESSRGQIPLSLAAIPLCLGLLRYPAVFISPFGQLVMAILSITRSLFGFLVIFAVTSAGFGVALFGLFPDLPLVNSAPAVFRTLFDAINRNYDLSMFDESAGQRSVGATVLVVFVVWTAAVLLNAVAAHMVSSYPSAHAQAHLDLQLYKARLVKQFLLVQEKSPLCMLPAPFNVFPLALYVVHVIYVWRARLWVRKVTCVSFAGTCVDLLLRCVFLVPAAIAEYFLVMRDEPSALRRSQHLVAAPYGVVACLVELLVKVFWRDPTVVRLLVKSRLRDGRLRVSYGDSRDLNEVIGVAERLDKTFRFEKNGGGRGGKGGNGATMLLPGEALLDGSDVPLAARTKLKSASGGDVAAAAITGSNSNNSNKYNAKVVPSYSALENGNSGDKGGMPGDQSFLWQTEMDQALARGLGQDEGEESKQLVMEGGQGSGGGIQAGRGADGNSRFQALKRENSLVSLMSDTSTGDVLQGLADRFPPTEPVNNDLDDALLHPTTGLFLPHEKRQIFSGVLKDVFDDQARFEASLNDPHALMLELRASVVAGLDDAADRTEKQFMQLAAMLDGLGQGGGIMGPDPGAMSHQGFGFGAPQGSPYSQGGPGAGGLRVGFHDSQHSVAGFRM